MKRKRVLKIKKNNIYIRSADLIRTPLKINRQWDDIIWIIFNKHFHSKLPQYHLKIKQKEIHNLGKYLKRPDACLNGAN